MKAIGPSQRKGKPKSIIHFDLKSNTIKEKSLFTAINLSKGFKFISRYENASLPDLLQLF